MTEGDASTPAAPVPEPTPAPKTAGPRMVGFDPSVEERKRRAEEHWERVAAARENGEIFLGVVSAAVKGGLLVDVGGIGGFLPASHTRVEPGGSLESFVKTKLPLRVIDVDPKRRRIVVSHRRALDDERRAERTELMRVDEGGKIGLSRKNALADVETVATQRTGFAPLGEELMGKRKP